MINIYRYIIIMVLKINYLIRLFMNRDDNVIFDMPLQYINDYVLHPVSSYQINTEM